LPLLGLASDGGCLAADIAACAGGLLHRLFTLTPMRGGCFLWPFPRVAPPGDYPASHSMERGLSSNGLGPFAITRSAHLFHDTTRLNFVKIAFDPQAWEY